MVSQEELETFKEYLNKELFPAFDTLHSKKTDFGKNMGREIIEQGYTDTITCSTGHIYAGHGGFGQEANVKFGREDRLKVSGVQRKMVQGF